MSKVTQERNRFIGGKGEYFVGDEIFYRIRDLYIEYFSNIKIKSESDNIKDFFKTFDLKRLIELLVYNFFTNKTFSLIIIDGKSLHANPLSLYSRNIIYDFFIGERNRSYHSSRVIQFKESIFQDKCSYLKKACQNYERAVLNASFCQDHQNHTIVHLGSRKDINQNYESSLLGLSEDNKTLNKIKNLDSTLDTTLVSDQYRMTILGTKDKVERLNLNFSYDAFKVIKQDLIAKSGIPEPILFGSNQENMSDVQFKNFYERINKMFEIQFLPIVKKILEKIGLNEEIYFERLVINDEKLKKQDLESMIRLYQLLKDSNDTDLKNEVEKKIKDLLPSL